MKLSYRYRPAGMTELGAGSVSGAILVRTCDHINHSSTSYADSSSRSAQLKVPKISSKANVTVHNSQISCGSPGQLSCSFQATHACPSLNFAYIHWTKHKLSLGAAADGALVSSGKTLTILACIGTSTPPGNAVPWGK